MTRSALQPYAGSDSPSPGYHDGRRSTPGPSGPGPVQLGTPSPACGLHVRRPRSTTGAAPGPPPAPRSSAGPHPVPLLPGHPILPRLAARRRRRAGGFHGGHAPSASVPGAAATVPPHISIQSVESVDFPRCSIHRSAPSTSARAHITWMAFRRNCVCVSARRCPEASRCTDASEVSATDAVIWHS